MPSGSNAPLPTASLCAGTPNRITDFTPISASWVTSACRLSRECWTTPGSDGIGIGASMPSRTNSGATRSAVRTVVSASMSRIACVVRSRRNRVVGNIAAIVRAGPPTTDGANQDGIRPVMSHRSPRARRRRRQRRRRPTVMPPRRRSRTRRARRLARCSVRSRRAGRPIRSWASALRSRPAPEHDHVRRSERGDVGPGGARAHRRVRLTAVTSWPRARNPSTRWRLGEVALGDEHGRRARPGTRRAIPRRAGRSGTRSAVGRPAAQHVAASPRRRAASRTRDAWPPTARRHGRR